MRKDWKYILYLSVAFGIFVLLKLISPKQHNWAITLGHEDKNPYGAYAFSELMHSLFQGNEINHSYQTIYEIKDSLKRAGSLISISLNFNSGKEDAQALLGHVHDGGTAFLSAHYFNGYLGDTLKVGTSDYFFADDITLSRQDTSIIQVVNPELHESEDFYFKRDDIHNYFSKFDSTITKVIARNDRGNPVTIRIPWGKGNLILNSTPLAFTNIYILSKNNHRFISSMMSYLPQTEIEWTEFYHVGRRETATPLRYVLRNEPLSWAYYITIISLVLFMIFEMKRKQRIIPIIKPLENTTLEFVRTIGNLYYQSEEHKTVADKKINYFFDYIRTRYWLQPTTLDEEFVMALSRKSGRSESNVRSLISVVRFIQSQQHIAVDRLVDLNEHLENFYSPGTNK